MGFEDDRSSAGGNSTLFATTFTQPSLNMMMINGTGRSSLWQKPTNDNLFSIQNWNDLQDKLKEEYNLIIAGEQKYNDGCTSLDNIAKQSFYV